MCLLILRDPIHLDSPQHILDIGAGTGIWAIDSANKYPSAEVIGTEVIGTDLSPIQRSWYVLFQLLTV